MDESAVDFFSYFILMTQTRPFAACVSSVAAFPAIFSLGVCVLRVLLLSKMEPLSLNRIVI